MWPFTKKKVSKEPKKPSKKQNEELIKFEKACKEAQVKIKEQWKQDIEKYTEIQNELTKDTEKTLREFSLGSIKTVQNKWGSWLIIPHFDVDVYLNGIVDIKAIPGSPKTAKIQEYGEYVDMKGSYHREYLFETVPVPQISTTITFTFSTDRIITFRVPLEI